MGPSGVHASSAAQWLQGLLATGAPSQTGIQPSAGSTDAPRDSTNISARAFQLNQAAGTSLKTDSQRAPSSAVSAAHHHHHGGHKGHASIANDVAQAGVSASPQRTGSIASANPAAGIAAASLDDPSGSFIQELARKVAHDIRTAYSHVTAPEASPSQTRGSESISVTA